MLDQVRITFGSNIPSLQAQRQLAKGADTVSRVSERLASGQRINRAADDAAGLAIASSLEANRRVYSQSIRNINDGLSAIAIADGAIGELSKVVTRIQELAEQSANGSYGMKQRQAMDREARALRDEFNRIVESTSFNGNRLLDGSTEGFDIQVGNSSSADARINVNVGAALAIPVGTGQFSVGPNIAVAGRQDTLGVADFNGDGRLDVWTQAGTGGGTNLLLGNGDGTFLAPQVVAGLGASPVLAIGDLNGDGLPDVIKGRFDGTIIAMNTGGGTFSASILSASIPGAVELSDLNNDGRLDLISRRSNSYQINLGNGDGTFGAASSYGTVASTSEQFVVGDFNGDGNQDLVTAQTFYLEMRLGSGDGTFNSAISLSGVGTLVGFDTGDFNGDGLLDITYSQSSGNGRVRLGNGDGTFGGELVYNTGAGSTPRDVGDLNGDGFDDIIGGGTTALTWLSNGDGTFRVASTVSGLTGNSSAALGDFNSDGVLDQAIATFNGASVQILNGVGVDSPYLPSVSLTTVASSKLTLDAMSSVLSDLSYSRSTLGASQSRLIAALQSIEATRLNTTSALSRIMDADVALESSELLRTQILQRAATSVLAQANIQPQIGLRLLR